MLRVYVQVASQWPSNIKTIQPMSNTLIKAIHHSVLKFTATALISTVILLIPSILFISCNQSGNENKDWRYVGEDTLSIQDVFWCDYYKETAVGPLFWQMEFADTTITEHRSFGLNLLHQREIIYHIRKDTLVLQYPTDYVYDKFNKEGEFNRLNTEKWLMVENNDTLTLTFILRKTFAGVDHTDAGKRVYHFFKPSNKLVFPDYLIRYPQNRNDIIRILNNLYSEKGKEELMKHFNIIPDSLDYRSYGIRTSMIFEDLDKVFDTGNTPSIQQLFDHYHLFPIAGSIISVYLEYLENEEGYEF